MKRNKNNFFVLYAAVFALLVCTVSLSCHAELIDCPQNVRREGNVLYWDADPDADSYIVYRKYNSDDTKAVKLKKTTETKCTGLYSYCEYAVSMVVDGKESYCSDFY